MSKTLLHNGEVAAPAVFRDIPTTEQFSCLLESVKRAGYAVPFVLRNGTVGVNKVRAINAVAIARATGDPDDWEHAADMLESIGEDPQAERARVMARLKAMR